MWYNINETFVSTGQEIDMLPDTRLYEQVLERFGIKKHPPVQQAATLTGGEIFQAFRDGRQRAETEESPAAAFSKGRRRARSTGPTGESMRREESPETPGT